MGIHIRTDGVCRVHGMDVGTCWGGGLGLCGLGAARTGWLICIMWATLAASLNGVGAGVWAWVVPVMPRSYPD